MNETLGLGHFLGQADMVARGVLLALGVMSIATWYTMALKLWQFGKESRLTEAYLTACRTWGLAAQGHLPESELSFSRILCAGREACRRLRETKTHSACPLTLPEELVAAAMRQAVADALERREEGLATLASVGSTAPFVGLFGTVWGIYHALIAIGASGQASLERVAGPVGEALIMTACGLAVAIPAVLAYNACVRANRQMQGRLEAFALEAMTVFTTGTESVEEEIPATLRPELA